MKYLYTLLMVLNCAFLLNAQFSKVIDLSAALNPGIYDQVSEYNIWNDKLYYITYNSSDGSNNLNVTDGTAAGTTTVVAIPLPAEYSSMNVMCYKKAGNGLYIKFSVKDKITSLIYSDLWFTDGTAANTVRVAAYSRINIGGSLLAGIDSFSRSHQDSHVGNTFYFWKSDVGGNSTSNLYLWQSDGTVAGTQKVTAANNVHIPYDYDYQDEVLDFGLVYNGSYYFIGQDITSTMPRSKVYKLNASSTEEIGSYVKANRMGTVFKNKMYFIATYDNPNPNYYDEREIFVSDGTAAGTQIFYNFNNNADGVAAHDHFTFHKTNDYMFISTSNTTANPRQILATDGTTNFKTLYQGSATPIDIYFYYDDKMAYFTRKSTDVDHPISFAINLSDFSRTDITKSFYSNYGGQMHKGTLWLGNKSTYNTAIVRPWRSNGTDATTLESAAVNYANLFFKLNGKLYMFTSYLGALYNALYRFDDDFTFTNTSGDNLWSNPNNWLTNMMPLIFDDATIPLGSLPQISGDAYVNNLHTQSPISISSGNLNVNGILNLANKISLNGGNLVLKGSQSNILNGNQNNYIETNGAGSVKIEFLNSQRGNITLPIGTQNFYNPVSISNNGVSDTFSVKVSEGISNATDASVNATWEISELTPGGSDVSLSLEWNSAQHNSQFSVSSAKIGHYKNGNWEQENSSSVVGIGPFTLSATGVTEFSPFSVMNFSALATHDLVKQENNVYPNPYIDVIFVETIEDSEFYLYDANGKLVYRKNLNKGSNIIDDLPKNKSFYFYHILNENLKAVKSGKLIKK